MLKELCIVFTVSQVPIAITVCVQRTERRRVQLHVHGIVRKLLDALRCVPVNQEEVFPLILIYAIHCGKFILSLGLYSVVILVVC